jgi:hypothetical protein
MGFASIVCGEEGGGRGIEEIQKQNAMGVIRMLERLCNRHADCCSSSVHETSLSCICIET